MKKTFRPIHLILVLSALITGMNGAYGMDVAPSPPGNLHRVDSFLYRSEQPTAENLSYMESIGVRTVINLRNRFSDRHEVKRTGLVYVELPINSWKISYAHMVRALLLIHQHEKPILVHCLHGADRTGCVVACYRIVFMDWSKEEALADFLDPKYGYHDGWFPKMRELLEGLDVERLRKDVLSGIK